MKIAIVQSYNDAIRDYAQYSQLINSMYAVKHGYKYICWNYDLVPTEMSVYYNKLQAILNVMNSTGDIPDWIFWLDSDAIVTNFDINLEDIIDRHPGKQIIFGEDINGSNAGVFLIKNTDVMKKYMETSFSDSRFFFTRLSDQASMFANISTDEYKDYIGFENAQDFNGYINFYKGFKPVDRYWDDKSLTLHLARIPNNIRVDIFTQILKRHGIFCITKNNEQQVMRNNSTGENIHENSSSTNL